MELLQLYLTFFSLIVLTKGTDFHSSQSNSFVYEAVTPQRIITGCKGSRVTADGIGDTIFTYYIIDGTGNKKFIEPGGIVNVIFSYSTNPSFPNIPKAQLVRFNEICFPSQCLIITCGNIVGPLMFSQSGISESVSSVLTIQGNGQDSVSSVSTSQGIGQTHVSHTGLQIPGTNTVSEGTQELLTETLPLGCGISASGQVNSGGVIGQITGAVQGESIQGQHPSGTEPGQGIGTASVQESGDVSETAKFTDGGHVAGPGTGQGVVSGGSQGATGSGHLLGNDGGQGIPVTGEQALGVMNGQGIYATSGQGSDNMSGQTGNAGNEHVEGTGGGQHTGIGQDAVVEDIQEGNGDGHGASVGDVQGGRPGNSYEIGGGHVEKGNAGSCAPTCNCCALCQPSLPMPNPINNFPSIHNFATGWSNLNWPFRKIISKFDPKLFRQRDNLNYYASLPGSIQGLANVIYYPSCDMNAFVQPAILNYCPSNQYGRGLKVTETVVHA